MPLFQIHEREGGSGQKPTDEGNHLGAEALPRLQGILQDLLLVLRHRPQPRPALPHRGHGPADGRSARVVPSFLQLRGLALQGHDFLVERVNP